jgi:hypothetical protein
MPLEDPGVQMSNLQLTLQYDSLELEQRTINRRIEEVLQEGKRLTSMYLPEAHGGELERVMAVVGELIASSQAAGIRVGQAPVFHSKAVQQLGSGSYKKAFDNLRQAYTQMANIQ